MEDLAAKQARLQAGLDAFIERVAEDKQILAIVQVGSLSPETVWRRESLRLWLIEADGVTRRLKSDGEEPRIHRWFYEEGVRFRAELIPRSLFRQMVEGAARTAFSFNFFAQRSLVHCSDASIASWFEQANTVALRDQAHERMRAFGWLAGSCRHARQLLELKKHAELARQELLWSAHALAIVHVIEAGEVCEDLVIERGQALAPALFQQVYQPLLSPCEPATLEAVIQAVEAWIESHGDDCCRPVLRVLQREKRLVSLSELGDDFAMSQLHPSDLEDALDWLARSGRVQRLSASFRATRRSRVELEEPAYILKR